MTISVTNGTLTRLSETLFPSTGKLPDTVTVSGATSSYNTSTGALELTSLTDTVSITAAEITPTVAFDLDSLGLAAGNYTITVRSKGTGYRDSEASNSVTYTVLEQLSTPSNLSVSGTNVTMDEVANATSYELFANGTSIGEYEVPTGYSGNITPYQYIREGHNTGTRIKFGTAPESNDDYDSYVDMNGVLTGASSYTNQTKAYIWGDGDSGVKINNSNISGGPNYLEAVGITLTGNYNISLFYGIHWNNGGSND